MKRQASEISGVIPVTWNVIPQEQKVDQGVPETPVAPNEALEDHIVHADELDEYNGES